MDQDYIYEVIDSSYLKEYLNFEHSLRVGNIDASNTPFLKNFVILYGDFTSIEDFLRHELDKMGVYPVLILLVKTLEVDTLTLSFKLVSYYIVLLVEQRKFE